MSGFAKEEVARISITGLVDSGFTASVLMGNTYVSAIGIQSDDSIILGGSYPKVS